MNRRSLPTICVLAAASVVLSAAPARGGSTESAKLTREQMEEFLRTAKIIKTKALSKGVTGSQRVTMTDGKITHDAHVQTIDVAKPEFKTDRGVELNFKDSYKFNIAAYKLAKILGIENIPVSVERKIGGKTAAVTWWVDDVVMDEKIRHAKKMDAPNPEAWNEQMYVVRVFDQLIHNVDRNLENLLITQGWQLEMIDHTRAFRILKTLRNPKDLAKCDRTLLKNLRALDKDTLMRELRPYCTKTEIEALLARRDLIVKFFDTEAAAKGEAEVLYDLRKVSAK